jgi:integrase
MTCEFAVNQYYDITMAYNKNSTNKINRYYCDSLIDCLNGLDILDLDKINYETGYRIIKYLKSSRNMNNDTINRVLRLLKRIFLYHEISSPFLKFKLLSLNTNNFKRLYHDDLKLIIDYVKVMNFSKNSLVYRTMIYLLLDSGLRITELLNIKINNIDLSSERYKILIENTKTGKQRYAPFSEFSADSIRELINIDPNRKYLFMNLLKDRQLNKNDVKLFYKRLSEKLGIERIHSHRFRKTFASILVENGMSIDVLQKLIGHSRITTTMLYVQYNETRALKEYLTYNNWHMN